jgi:hypothetical protein
VSDVGRTVRELIGAASGDEPNRLRVLRDALPLALRIDPAFAAEVFGLVRPALLEATGEPGQNVVVHWQCELLGQVLVVAGRTGRADLVREWADWFAEMAGRFPLESRLNLVRTAGPQCLLSLQALGLSDDIDRVFARLGGAIPHAIQNTDAYVVANFYRSKLVLVAGWLTRDRVADATPVLERVRHELLSGEGLQLVPMYYAELAGA